MQRYLFDLIRNDLDRKIVLLSGPRQVGKTTMAKSFYVNSSEYFNMDNAQDRLLIKKMAWRRDADLIIFDELHKIKKWKGWIKGIYDSHGIRPRLFVTGSSRLDILRKGGDSLAGRFFHFRLHPISIAEVKNQYDPAEALDRIMKFGGFPEPFLNADEIYTKRWRKSHIETILKEDVLDVSSVHDIRGIETLTTLLSNCVGSSISYESLSRDLEVSPHTIKQWIKILESLYIIFVIHPYSNNIARSLLKQPKVYFYDTGAIKDDPGARFENAVACALLKRLHFLEDALGEKCALNYLKDKEKREVDFIMVRNSKPESLIEAKLSDTKTSSINHFAQFFDKEVSKILLVKNIERELFLEGVHVKRADVWLSKLEA